MGEGYISLVYEDGPFIVYEYHPENDLSWIKRKVVLELKDFFIKLRQFKKVKYYIVDVRPGVTYIYKYKKSRFLDELLNSDGGRIIVENTGDGKVEVQFYLNKVIVWRT